MPRPKKTPTIGVTDDQAQEKPATAKPARKKSPRKSKAQVQAPGAQENNASWYWFGLY